MVNFGTRLVDSSPHKTYLFTKSYKYNPGVFLIETPQNKAPLMNDLVPSEFYLSQNYPNPFKDRTSIKYCLSEKASVKLILLNSNGECIKELFNKVQNAGTYETIFENRDWPAGDYYYQLKAVDIQLGTRQLFDQTKKMILMK